MSSYRTDHDQEIHAIGGQDIVTLIALLAWAEAHEEAMGHHDQLARHRHLIHAMGLQDEVARLRFAVEGMPEQSSEPAPVGGGIWS